MLHIPAPDSNTERLAIASKGVTVMRKVLGATILLASIIVSPGHAQQNQALALCNSPCAVFVEAGVNGQVVVYGNDWPFLADATTWIKANRPRESLAHPATQHILLITAQDSGVGSGGTGRSIIYWTSMDTATLCNLAFGANDIAPTINLKC